MTFSLSRFEFDWQKMERKKINDQFQFGLELDISVFAEKPELYADEDDKIYELFAVLIHRGDAYGGHYHAYIRDTLNEADWEGRFAHTLAQKEKRQPEKEKEQKKEEASTAQPQEGETKTENPSGSQAQPENTQEVEAQKVEDKKEGENAEEGNENESTGDEEEKQETPSVVTQSTRKILKRKRQRAARQQKKKNRKRTAAAAVGTDTANDKKEEEKKEKYDDTVFDDVDFPIEFKNQNLRFNWFDFNDSSVTAIPVNRIQRQFGGTSENAYILIYRQRSLSKAEGFKKIELQDYLKKYIQEKNLFYENERASYKDAEEHLEVITMPPEEINVIKSQFSFIC